MAGRWKVKAWLTDYGDRNFICDGIPCRVHLAEMLRQGVELVKVDGFVLGLVGLELDPQLRGERASVSFPQPPSHVSGLVKR